MIPSKKIQDILHAINLNLNTMVECNISCTSSNIFINGNYLKIQRNISQTPWIIGGKQLYEGSISESLCKHIYGIFEPKEIKFHSGGSNLFNNKGRTLTFECLATEDPLFSSWCLQKKFYKR